MLPSLTITTHQPLNKYQQNLRFYLEKSLVFTKKFNFCPKTSVPLNGFHFTKKTHRAFKFRAPLRKNSAKIDTSKGELERRSKKGLEQSVM